MYKHYKFNRMMMAPEGGAGGGAGDSGTGGAGSGNPNGGSGTPANGGASVAGQGTVGVVGTGSQGVTLTLAEYQALVENQKPKEEKPVELEKKSKEKTELEVNQYKKSYIDGLLKTELDKKGLGDYFTKNQGKLLTVYHMEDERLISARVMEIALGIETELNDIREQIKQEEADKLKNTDTKITTKGIPGVKKLSVGDLVGKFISSDEKETSLDDFK